MTVGHDITGQPVTGFRGWDLSSLRHLCDLQALLGGIGGEVFATGPTGAALFSLDGYLLRPPFHLLVLRGRNVTRVGHYVHTTRDLPLIDRAVRHDVRTTSATRTLMMLAELEPADRVTAAYDSAIRDGFTSEDFVHARIAALRRRGRGGLLPLLEVIEGIEITRGGHSWLERRFLELVAAAGLPRPSTQVVLGRRGDKIIRVDVHFPGTPVVVELLGYRHHRTKSQTTIDAQRLNRLQLAGHLVLQFSYSEVVEESGEVIAVVRAALDRAEPVTAA